MENFFYEFFVSPILEKTGYNMVNTFVYAVIALVAVYLIWKGLKRTGIVVDKEFFFGTLAFVLFGSTMRVVTDSVDSGVFSGVTPVHQLILDSGIYNYGFLTVSPGTYILVAAIYLVCLFGLHFMNRIQDLKWVGLALFAFHFLLLVPFMDYAAHAIPVLILTAIPTYLAYRYFGDILSATVVAGHALDGAATFYIIDIFPQLTGISYFEQHVIPRMIGEAFDTYFLFYLVKIAVAGLAAYVVKKEKIGEQEKTYILLVFAIAGLAPGVRDVLRMVVGA